MDREGGPDLPPLNALRAFESAARLGSMTRAGVELCVTQTAISHQVRQLEELLAIKLFMRDRPGRIRLSAEGRAWAEGLSDVFRRLHELNRRLRAREARRPTVAVTALPSFASGWLVPRLGGFFVAHRDIDLKISPSERLVDLDAEAVDVGIRYGACEAPPGRGRASAQAVAARYPGLATEKLLDDAWVVVCTPELARRARLRRPEDLAGQLLLRDDEPDGWRRWLAWRGKDGRLVQREHDLSDSSLVVEAALRGQGVALARWSLAADALAQGKLVRPFSRAPLYTTGRAYFLVVSPRAAARPEVVAFCRWLRREIRALVGQRPLTASPPVLG